MKIAYILFKMVVNGLILFAFLGTIITYYLQGNWATLTKEICDMIFWLIIANITEIYQISLNLLNIKQRRQNNEDND